MNIDSTSISLPFLVRVIASKITTAMRQAAMIRAIIIGNHRRRLSFFVSSSSLKLTLEKYESRDDNFDDESNEDNP